MANVIIRDKFPSVYAGFVEIDRLAEVEQKLFEELHNEVVQLIANQWILTATAEGLTQYESMFGIVASPTDTLDFRRERLINRLCGDSPYTYRYLIQRLDAFLGAKEYAVLLEHAEYRITFIVHIGQIGKLNELLKTLIEMLPSNLVMIVKNDILTENDTNMYCCQGFSYCSEYILTSTIREEYVLDHKANVAHGFTDGMVYELS